jgi:hypothetical protein
LNGPDQHGASSAAAGYLGVAASLVVKLGGTHRTCSSGYSGRGRVSSLRR